MRGLKGTYVTVAMNCRQTLPCCLAHPKGVGSRAAAPPRGALGQSGAASMLDELALPPLGLDTIFPGLTFSVTGEPRDKPEPASDNLLTKAPPAGGT